MTEIHEDPAKAHATDSLKGSLENSKTANQARQPWFSRTCTIEARMLFHVSC